MLIVLAIWNSHQAVDPRQLQKDLCPFQSQLLLPVRWGIRTPVDILWSERVNMPSPPHTFPVPRMSAFNVVHAVIWRYSFAIERDKYGWIRTGLKAYMLTEMSTISSPCLPRVIDGPIANPSPPLTKAVNLLNKGRRGEGRGGGHLGANEGLQRVRFARRLRRRGKDKPDRLQCPWRVARKDGILFFLY